MTSGKKEIRSFSVIDDGDDHGDDVANDDDVNVDIDDDMNPYEIDQIPWSQTPWGSTVTRASSSKLADGASACILMNNDGLAM